MSATASGPRRVAVTGLGVVSPWGADAGAFFDALLAGRSAVGRRSAGEAPFETSLLAAACDGFDPAPWLDRSRLIAMDRHAQLAAVAALSAWRQAGLDDQPDAARDDAAVLWGTGAGGAAANERGYRELFVRQRLRVSPLSVVLGMHNAAAAHLGLLLRLGGPCLTYAVACASAATAIGEALRLLRSGSCDVVLAGGSEAAMPYGAVKAWQSLQVLAEAGPDDDPARACRPFDRRRSGLVPGEGAAALVLEDWSHAMRRGAPVLAELAGYGASADHHHLTAPHAAGQVRALRAALRDAGAAADEVGYVNAHGTATPEGDPVEIAALREVFGAAAPRLPVSATKSMHGHLMGAAGAVEAACTVLALQRGALPPTAGLDAPDPRCEGVDHVRGSGRDGVACGLALSSSFAFGGSNAVLAFRRAA